MIIVRYFFRQFLLVLLLSFSCALAEGGGLKAYARVGDRVINQNDLEREFYGRLELAENAKKEISSLDSKFVSSTIDRLIDRALLLEYGKEKSLFDEDKVQKGLSAFIAKMGGEAVAESKIVSRGVKWESWKANFWEDLRILMISESISKKFGTPTKEEVDDFMKKHPKQVYDPERVKIRVIVLNEGNPLWDDAKLAPFVKDLKEHSETFHEKAQKYSDGKSAPSGGSQGFIFKGTFDKTIENLIYNLKIGEVSDAVSFGAAKYIFMVEERNGGRPNDENKAKMATEALQVAKSTKNLRELIDTLKAKTAVEKYLP